MPILLDSSTPEPGPMLPVDYHGLDRAGDHELFENINTMPEFTESPDSGHREMSSDSLACSAGQPDVYSWCMSTNVNGQRSHGGIKRSVSSNGYTPGSMSANNRPELNLPLRTSSNPFTVPAPSSQHHYANLSSCEPAIITPLPMQDASGNRLDLNTAPKLDPPPKVNRRSSRTPTTAASVTSPDSNGNRSGSSASTMSDHSFEVHLNQLLEQATMNHNNMTDNIVNERKELNTLPKPENNLNKNTVNNLNHSPRADRAQHMSPLILSTARIRKLSFSDEENTEEVEESDLKDVLKSSELEMFSDLEAFSS